MSPGAKVAGFMLVLLLVFGAGLGLGRAVGPVGVGGDGSEQVDEPHGIDDREATT
ncbi:MAG TPA: hypothetical protein VK891_16215 [Euzebyales bacterium]|nr:hypothetical protein [Euzebyales bacterium]